MNMKAVRIHENGDVNVLKLEEIAVPTPNEGEVQIRVKGASINPADVWMRKGGPMMPPINFPVIPGWDVSGVVTEVGENVTEFAVGDEVYGMVNFPQLSNAYAEYTVSPVAHIAKKAANLSHVEAAAMPLVALTAWQALFDVAGLQAGQRVLIHAAAGGVGHIAVQLAKWKGAHVIGTASAANEQYLRELGVDEFINYREVSFEEALKDAPVDVVLSTVAGDTTERSFDVVKPGGFVVSIVADAAAMAKDRDVRGAQVLVHTSGSQLAEMAQLSENGQLKSTVSKVYPLADVKDAHLMSESGRVRGKLVLSVGE